MPKRSWMQAHGSPQDLPPVYSAGLNYPQERLPWNGDLSENPRSSSETNSEMNQQTSVDVSIPALSRKIKACNGCRRQKIKCIIDESGPPCRRCTKHGLDCVINRNLQTIIDEKTQYTDAIIEDLHQMHTVLRELVKKAGLPEPNILHTTALRHLKASSVLPNEGPYSLQNPDHGPQDEQLYDPQRDGNRPPIDNSPEISAEEDSGLPHVPIQSLYALTKLKSLKSPRVLDEQLSPSGGDLIGRGAVNQEDAERLFALYRDRLDAFIYGIGCRYPSLEETRSKCPILALAILSVAALHDSESNEFYTTCSAELRRLISLTMFDRHTSRDYLRAMCVASYWLSDISWMISGHAIRRASECALHSQPSEAIEKHTEEAADGARLWFILKICDQRLATLYGRPAIVYEDSSVAEIDSFLQMPMANSQDKRLMGQVALLSIFKSVRELFGPDKGKPIHRSYIHQICHFNKQLDDWLSYWSGTVSEHYDHIGAFPRKAVRLHYQFAKLHLNSHVFRGLSAGEPIPYYFMESTTTAIEAATSTIDFILNDVDVASVVVGIPSYLHCMTAFACMFLIKVSLKYGTSLIEPNYVWNITTRLVEHFRSVPAGNWHLTKLMAPGLERMASMLHPNKQPPARFPRDASRSGMDGFQGAPDIVEGVREIDSSLVGFEGDFLFDYNMNLGLSPIFPFDLGTIHNIGGPGVSV